MIKVRIDCDNIAESNYVKSRYNKLKEPDDKLKKIIAKFRYDEEKQEEILLIGNGLNCATELFEKVELHYKLPREEHFLLEMKTSEI